VIATVLAPLALGLSDRALTVPSAGLKIPCDVTPVKSAAKHRIRAILRSEGRSVVWLARQTGYSRDHITRVDEGKHPGAEKFWIAVKAALGRDAA
jgi:hypothetical protein